SAGYWIRTGKVSPIIPVLNCSEIIANLGAARLCIQKINRSLVLQTVRRTHQPFSRLIFRSEDSDGLFKYLQDPKRLLTFFRRQLGTSRSQARSHSPRREPQFLCQLSLS